MTEDLPPPPLQALLLLEAYNMRQSVGQLEQKDCLWNLQKARRHAMRQSVVNSDVYSATSVREDLYPRAMVVASKDDDIVPQLLSSEGRCNAKNMAGCEETVNEVELLWRLVDPVAITEKKSQTETSEDREIFSSNNKENDAHGQNQGLRRRKGQPKTDLSSVDSSKWKTELETDAIEKDEEEVMLRNANPIELFGALPPKDLKQAQVNANAALQAYIDAANFAVALLKIVEKSN